MQFKDYYEILGVPPGANADVIKSAYRRLARKYHPDVSKEKDAEEKFKAVNEAYEALKDNKRRKAYDELRTKGYRPGEEFRPPPNWNREHEFDFGDGDDGAGFSDFFETLFGKGARPGGARGAGPRRPRDVQARLQIPLERAFTGGPERVQLGSRTLEIKIPAGIESGRQIRLAGQADGGGDVLLEIAYQPHARFAVEGRDLVVHVPVAPWEAALGTTIEVPTLAGAVEIRIPAGSNSGRKMRLKGRGMPGKSAGDQYVVLDIVAPAAQDDAQRAAWDALRETYPDFVPRQ
jgi:curved DNA-binding protein